LNKAEGVCAITSLGAFDYVEGGHLVLPNLKLLIEFPPGVLILLPSSVLRHGNTALALGDRRMSFTQYMAGGLHRWYEYGCRSVRTVEASTLPQDKKLVKKMRNQAKTAFREALRMWSTTTELAL
jgi:hypothetical protein